MSQGTMHLLPAPKNLIRFPALPAPGMEKLAPLPHVAQPVPGTALPSSAVPCSPSLLGPPDAAMPPDRVTPGAALAHDARNALSSLSLLSDMLAEPGVLMSAHAGLAGDLRDAVARLSALVLELTAGEAAARRTASIADTAQESRAIGQVLTGCRRILDLTAGPRVAVHLSFESGLPAVALADSNLERVLVNLVKNAAEAMPEGGAVRITARRALSRTAPAVLLHVSDDGPGIPAHALEQIFEAGFSTKRSTRPWQVECGLGLTIVRQLLEAAGGTIRAASTPRRGTTFEIRLPVRA